MNEVKAIDYKCAGIVFDSRLYMLLKLAIAITSSDPEHLQSDKAYHILYTDQKNHYTH